MMVDRQLSELWRCNELSKLVPNLHRKPAQQQEANCSTDRQSFDMGLIGSVFSLPTGDAPVKIFYTLPPVLRVINLIEWIYYIYESYCTLCKE